MDHRPARAGADGLRRLRWRLRGALMWPAFALFTVVGAAIMHWLPIAGEGTGWIPALLLAGCLNIAGVALRRARPSLPKVVADDYAGTFVLGLLALAFLTAGLVHRPELAGDRDAFAAQSQAVHRWVDANGDAFMRAHVGLADTLRVDRALYRTCIPSPAPRRYDCLIVDTTGSPPHVKRDANRESNSSMNRRGGFR